MLDEQRLKHIFNVYKKNAKGRELDFSLNIRQVRLMSFQNCVYCGEKIEGVGIDRIDSSKGYHYDNVVPCCRTCNYAKRAMPLEDYVKHCENVYYHYEDNNISEWKRKLFRI